MSTVSNWYELNTVKEAGFTVIKLADMQWHPLWLSNYPRVSACNKSVNIQYCVCVFHATDLLIILKLNLLLMGKKVEIGIQKWLLESGDSCFSVINGYCSVFADLGCHSNYSMDSTSIYIRVYRAFRIALYIPCLRYCITVLTYFHCKYFVMLLASCLLSTFSSFGSHNGFLSIPQCYEFQVH